TLSSSSSFFLSSAITASYFGGIYLLRAGRISFVTPSPENEGPPPAARKRDDPDVIRARLRGVGISSLLSCGLVYTLVALDSRDKSPWTASIATASNLLGLNFSTKAALSCLLVPVLYLGPLTAMWFSRGLPLQRNWSFQRDLLSIFKTWIGLRNFVVAPITEEVVFRSCLLVIAQLSGKGLYNMVFITPLWFGAAHLHHAYELYHNYGRTRQALMRAL
ncbi:hypothetical protein M422DRAFT_103622, partial [Sphaerobolus stellatus SS14]